MKSLPKLHASVLKSPFYYFSSLLGKRLAFYTSLFFVITLVGEISAQTRLGLHVTQEELNIWRKRAQVGPYRFKGYTSINSPNDWERILKNADSFVSNPSSERWRASTSGCIKVDSREPIHNGEKIRDAGFAYLITGNTSYRNAVRSELLAQVGEPSTKFSNKNIWCDGRLDDKNPSFPYAEWLSRLLFAYDYVKSSLSSSDRETIDTWFYHAASFFQRNIDASLAKNFVNRNAGDYRLTDYADRMNDAPGSKNTHYNGHRPYSLAKFYNNRRSAQVRFFTLVGIQQNNSLFKNSGKRYVKEWLMYSTYPSGVIGEFERWESGFADQGWSYASFCIAQAVDIADHFARIGDMELYNFSTSQGYYGTAGGNKTLLLTVENLLDCQNGSVKRYATTSSGSLNSTTLIDGRNTRNSWYAVNDIWFAQSNIYYRKNYIRDQYLRKASSMSDYPFQPASSGAHHPWGGAWDAYPGILFMFGDMENKVWPYPNASRPSLQSDPSNNNTITVNAYGKNSPKFRVVVNGIIVGDQSVSGSAQNYKFTTKFALGDIKTVLIVHYNDDDGRDLYVNSITVGSQTIKANSSSVKYDKYNVDGRDIINGQTAMLWDGALVFKPSGQGQNDDSGDDDDDDPQPTPTDGMTVSVKAYSTISGGVYGHFKVLVNGSSIGDTYTTSSLKEYKFTSDWDISDVSRVIVEFDNDRNKDGEDRNLFVESITINGVELSPNSSSVKYDRYGLDGKDVVAGREDMKWPGFLIFTLPSSLTNAAARQDFSTEGSDPELSKINDVVIAPNPNSGEFTLFVDMNAETDVALIVMDMIGNVLYEESYPGVSYQLDEKIVLTELPAGMYLMKVLVGNESVVKKFVKQ